MMRVATLLLTAIPLARSPAQEPEIPDLLRIASGSCAPGAAGELFLLASHSGRLGGLEASFRPAEGLEIESVDREGCPLLCEVAFFLVSSGEGCRSLGILVDLAGEKTLPPGIEQRVARLRIRAPVEAAAGSEHRVDLIEGCGPVGSLFAVQEPDGRATKAFPRLEGGSLRMEPGEPPGPPRIPPSLDVCLGSPIELEVPSPVEESLEAWILEEGESCWSVLDAAAGRIAVPHAPLGTHRVRVRATSAPGPGEWSEMALSVKPCRFFRGDADSNRSVEITDPIAILSFLFTGGPPPACQDAADADDSGEVEITDAIRTLGFLFLGAAPLAPPAGECGPDPAEDALAPCADSC